jgi:hypothetical protein
MSFLIYQSEDGRTRIDVMLESSTLWLSQKQLTELFGKAKGTVSEHIKHIFEDGELTPQATVRLLRTVQTEGGRSVEHEVEHYNLDMILALGFRVRSPMGARFRRWANDTLKEYLIKGFVLDDERLKQPNKVLGSDYFDELSRRLQDIRTSERRFYQKITDTNLQQSATSVDDDPQGAVTQTFFAPVQNKLHFAVHGHTAAELITARAKLDAPNMGLTAWQGARIRKTDVSVAKNYLQEGELRALNNLAEQYLIFAEGQAQRRAAMTMQDWVNKLEGFLTLNDRELLQGAGTVSAELAKANAELVFTQFKMIENMQFESDFDRALLALPSLPERHK